jgi:hypothetical protein
MPGFCSKRMPLPGAGLVAALRSVFAELTPSASGESEVSKHYSPTNHQPKNKVKIKIKVKSKKSNPYKGARAAKGAG